MESSKRHLENLIDGYFAGRLTFEQTEELFALLREDPAALDKLLAGDMPSLVASSESFPHKSRLRKSYSDLSADQFEYLCIASLEGDLDNDQIEELNFIISSDPEKAAVYNTYKMLRMEPATVTFKAKGSLKKTTPAGRVIRMGMITLSAAASLALLITAITWFNNSAERVITSTLAAGSETGDERDITPAVTEIREAGSDREEIDAAPEKDTSTHEQSKTTQKQPIRELPSIVKSPPKAMTLLALNEPVTEEAYQPAPERSSMPAPVSGSEVMMVLASAVPSSKLADVLNSDIIPYHGPISLKEHLAMNFREKILGEEVPDISPIKAYEIASAGITGINKLLGWEINFEVKKETSGEVNALAFNSRLINFETPVKKADNEQ